MKPWYPICALALVFGCDNSHQPDRGLKYEFHSGAGGYVIWRCDRVTGDAYFCDYRDRTRNSRPPEWHRVLDPHQPPSEPTQPAHPELERTKAPQPQTVETPYGSIEFPAEMSAAQVRAETERFVRAQTARGGLHPQGTMPLYTVNDPQTGRTVTFRGDSPPSAEELTNTFAQIEKGRGVQKLDGTKPPLSVPIPVPGLTSSIAPPAHPSPRSVPSGDAGH